MTAHIQIAELESDIALNQRLLQFVEGGMSGALEVANDISQYCQGDEELQNQTQDIMLTFINMERELKQYCQAMKQVKSKPAQEEFPSTSSGDTGSLSCAFHQKLQDLRSSSASQAGDRDALAQHPKFREMQDILQSRGNVEEQLAELRERLTQEGDADESQGELAMTGAEINTRCPYTGCTMQDPVRNKICGHVYDRDGILNHIKQKKTKARCPVGGCGNTEPMNASDLEDHQDLKRYINLLAQSQRI